MTLERIPARGGAAVAERSPGTLGDSCAPSPRARRCAVPRGILGHETVTLRMAPDVHTEVEQARDTLGGDLPVVRVTVPRAADTVPITEVGGILNG